mmetsp:Transcript_27025/g.43439  ORF Transcript_27025/g.43439 Transcript_27025/m.43439 type:complete len:90 (+) Transcript_27025:265-534(+)
MSFNLQFLMFEYQVIPILGAPYSSNACPAKSPTATVAPNQICQISFDQLIREVATTCPRSCITCCDHHLTSPNSLKIRHVVVGHCKTSG